jgi:heme exporter protein CcmB
MNIRNMAACRWIIVGDLLSISRQRRGFLLPALIIGLAHVGGMSLLAAPGATTLLPAVVLTLSVLTAAALSLDSVVRSDVRNGTMQQLLLAAQPRAVIVVAKCVAHWLLSGAPCIALTMLSGWMLQVSAAELAELLTLLLIGTPAISIGATALGMRPAFGNARQPSWTVAPDGDRDACQPPGLPGGGPDVGGQRILLGNQISATGGARSCG